MNIAAITTYKHGGMLKALTKLGWTSAELARRMNIRPCEISHLMTLKRKPKQDMANQIQRVFGEGGLYVDVTEWWPEAFTGMKERVKSISFADIDPEAVSALDTKTDYRLAHLTDAIKSLPNQQRRMMDMRFDGKTLKEAGKEMNVGVERARQIEFRAKRKIMWLVLKSVADDDHFNAIEV